LFSALLFLTSILLGMTKLLLNCDLGEWESLAEAGAFIEQVDLINIACGGHAGSAEQLAH